MTKRSSRLGHGYLRQLRAYVLILFLALAAFTGALPREATAAWSKATIDDSGTDFTGWFTSIAVDGDQKTHVSYTADYTLKYATNTSGTWVTTTVDSTTTAQWTSIAVDNNGKVHISYTDMNNGDLKYATNATGTWVKATVDNSGFVG